MDETGSSRRPPHYIDRGESSAGDDHIEWQEQLEETLHALKSQNPHFASQEHRATHEQVADDLAVTAEERDEEERRQRKRKREARDDPEQSDAALPQEREPVRHSREREARERRERPDMPLLRARAKELMLERMFEAHRQEKAEAAQRRRVKLERKATWRKQ